MTAAPSSRTTALQISATNAAARRAHALRQSGARLIDLSRGELDLDPPDCVLAATTRALADSGTHHYGPPGGLEALRVEVARAWTTDANQLLPSQILITNGTKHALWQACMALINPGDDILLPAPYWASYPSMIELVGGRPVLVPTNQNTQYKVTPEVLDVYRSAATKALVYVSPANPTGAVYTDAEARAIGQWALDCGVAVISDEIYSDLVYPPYNSTSIVDLVPALAAQTLRVGGVGKSHAMTGWRVGWLAGPESIVAKAIAVQSHTSGHPCNIAQLAALSALTEFGSWLHDTKTTLDRRRQLVINGLSAIPGLTVFAPQGAFYAWTNVNAFLRREIAGEYVEDSAALAEILLEHAHVATVAGEAFGAPGHLRLSFATNSADINEGLARLADILSSRRPPRGGIPNAT